jgi:hypothetical protein
MQAVATHQLISEQNTASSGKTRKCSVVTIVVPEGPLKLVRSYIFVKARTEMDILNGISIRKETHLHSFLLPQRLQFEQNKVDPI